MLITDLFSFDVGSGILDELEYCAKRYGFVFLESRRSKMVTSLYSSFLTSLTIILCHTVNSVKSGRSDIRNRLLSQRIRNTVLNPKFDHAQKLFVFVAFEVCRKNYFL